MVITAGPTLPNRVMVVVCRLSELHASLQMVVSLRLTSRVLLGAQLLGPLTGNLPITLANEATKFRDVHAATGR